MSEVDARMRRLQQAHPNASYSSLFHLPQTLGEDPRLVKAFFRTWEAAEDLASMLETRVSGLSARYREPFPGITGPTFQELGLSHSSAFLQKIRKAAAVDGTVSSEFLYGAFGDELEKVRKLDKEVRERHLAHEIETLSQGRRRCLR